PDFGKAVEEAGMLFIGPRPETMAIFGDKISARKAARSADLLVLPGPDQALQGNTINPQLSEDISYPVLIKAAAGGGGKGIRLARSADELSDVIDLAREEAIAAFGDGTIYLEPLVQKARHIEVQILGDGTGQILTFGERECSIQRRHQKLIEESPASDLSPEERECVIGAAHRLGTTMKYRSLGTVEFLMDQNRQFYFIEVNPRIQVEHPVTEMVTGFDLVQEQIQLALTGKTSLSQSDINPQGAAIEARILAEDPDDDFMPTAGEISYLKEPGGPGIRVDSALYQGMEVTTDYDSMLSKVIAWGNDRQSAINRLGRGLREYQIGGLKTDLTFLTQILDSHPYQTGKIDTTFLDNFEPKDLIPEETLTRYAAVAAALHIHNERNFKEQQDKEDINPWRQKAWQEQTNTG
ncbi:MAG: ATP-grasp domain-containing protein, partial [Anaerolineales bacterium]|nr:ATP-grasp domain-containing protein [Anaerolineales bacterium]